MNKRLKMQLYDKEKQTYKLYYNYTYKAKLKKSEKNMPYYKLNKQHNREVKRIINPYLINIQNNQELALILKEYNYLMKNHAREETEIIKTEYKEITLNYFIIEKSIIQYLKTNNTIKNQMMEYNTEKTLTYKMYNYNEQLDNKILEVYDLDGVKHYKRGRIEKSNIYFHNDNKQYTKHVSYNTANIHETKIKEIDNYNILIQLLKNYFKQDKINLYEYINKKLEESKKILNSEDELEKLQKEYQEHNKKKTQYLNIS